MPAKYIFVTGGVVSGLGKGITAASIGRLLKARGYKIAMQKIDPYINIDTGMMSPLQHGEVFVTDDGAETDLDVGHYERFVDENMSFNSDITTGKIYWSVLNKERKGEYGGGTVQVVPHITNEIKEKIYKAAGADTDVVITEIGGTVGDMESQPYLEAIRQISVESGRSNTAFVHVTLVPYIPSSGELKSKPTQHSVKELLSIGIQPNIVVCRSTMPISQDIRSKIALFCNVRPQDAIQNINAPSLYEVPLLLEEEGLADAVCHHLNLENRTPDLEGWVAMINRQKNPKKKAGIALVGKYVALRDAYLSVAESINHAGIANQAKVDIKWVNCDDLISDISALKDVDGIVSVGDFGEGDPAGFIAAAKYARENDIPYLGIGLGMQAAVLDTARNIAGIENAGSTEFDADCEPVIDCLVDSRTGESPYIRKGLCPCKLDENSLAAEIYGDVLIYERHRCMYEVNPSYKTVLAKAGLVISGLSPDEHMAEIIEIPDKKWYIGVQFAPQYRSRPNNPHPLFVSFINAATSD